MAAGTKVKINIKPLDDRILIEQSEAEETSAGGIVLPDAAQEKPQRGVVRAVVPTPARHAAQVAPLVKVMGVKGLAGRALRADQLAFQQRPVGRRQRRLDRQLATVTSAQGPSPLCHAGAMHDRTDGPGPHPRRACVAPTLDTVRRDSAGERRPAG